MEEVNPAGWSDEQGDAVGNRDEVFATKGGGGRRREHEGIPRW
jgi:hypothetical protein